MDKLYKQNNGHSEQRAYSLDALRGYAILTMVLSATVAFGILPAWMYHMQEPPPSHAYCPEMSGLTWVDLVFPFFLFAMGAAFPFSIRKKFDRGDGYLKLVLSIIKRGVQLVFFSIFIQHFYPYMLGQPQDTRSWLLAICCFALLFPMFMRIPIKMPEWVHSLIKLSAYGVATIMLLSTNYASGNTFSLYTSNIIILILANMAIFGSIVYLFTMYNWKLRVIVLAVIASLILSSQSVGSWSNILYEYSPLPWMYRFKYLSYLFIVLPGSIAGDILMQWINKNDILINKNATLHKKAFAILFISILVILICLIGLYNRWSFITLILTVFSLFIGWIILRNQTGYGKLWNDLLLLGALLLVIGLCLEPFQGGIKKDGPTFSYLFVTSGLGCMALLSFNVICDYFSCRRATSFLTMSGQNPMIAYVACDLLIYPILNLTGITQWFDIFTISPWMGFMKGLLLTSIALLVTIFFTRRKCFWRT